MPEPEAFFHDLRGVRASAGLSLAGLAERAHFPEETLAAAEAGPALPPNPVLVAYVRACGGPVGQWEDRWRDASDTGDRPRSRSSQPRNSASSATSGCTQPGPASVSMIISPSGGTLSTPDRQTTRQPRRIMPIPGSSPPP
jgi:hypothetical protein